LSFIDCWLLLVVVPDVPWHVCTVVSGWLLIVSSYRFTTPPLP